MALNPGMVGQLFSKLNKKHLKLENLNPEQMSMIEEARKAWESGTKGFGPGTQVDRFFSKHGAINTTAPVSSTSSDLVEALRSDYRINEAIKEFSNIRTPEQRRKDLHKTITLRGEMEKSTSEYSLREERTQQYRAKQREIQRQRELEKAERERMTSNKAQELEIEGYFNERYDSAQRALVNQGFSEREARRAINRLKEDKLNLYNMSDDDLISQATDRLYDIRATNRINREIGERTQSKLGPREIERRRKKIIEEERAADAARRGYTTENSARNESMPENNSSKNSVKNMSMHKWLNKRFDQNISNISDALNSGQSLTDDTLKALGNSVRLSPKQLEKFISEAKSGNPGNALTVAQGNRDNYINNPTFGDQMIYNRVPQKAAVVVGGAWLVNNMSASRGQLSNAQLYGQQTPYM